MEGILANEGEEQRWQDARDLAYSNTQWRNKAGAGDAGDCLGELPRSGFLSAAK